MKKNMIAAAATMAAALGAWTLFAAVDARWIGGASGNWTDGANWSGGTYPNGKDCVARIEVSEATAISLSSDIDLAELHVSGADVSVSGGRFILNTSAASKEGIVDVAQGAVLSSAASFLSRNNLAQSFVKTGGGEHFVRSRHS